MVAGRGNTVTMTGKGTLEEVVSTIGGGRAWDPKGQSRPGLKEGLELAVVVDNDMNEDDGEELEEVVSVCAGCGKGIGA